MTRRPLPVQFARLALACSFAWADEAPAGAALVVSPAPPS